MNNVILISLTLRNFKGITDLSVGFGKETSIFGANESGKSTICTAFYWLLTGKDEFDRKDYELKNTVNKELNTQAHEVTGLFSVNGSDVELKRVYLEKWTKPRGQSQKVFEGHVTEFYINGVACRTATEYQDRVAEIIPAEIIKLITNPAYFNNMKPEDQRRGLLKLVGEITAEDILSSIATPDRDFAAVIGALNAGKKLEDYKRELSAKRLVLKKDAAEFAPRIEEASRNKPEALDWSKLEKEISSHSDEISNIDEYITDSSKKRAVQEKGITTLKNNLFATKQKIEDIRHRIRTEQIAKQKESTGQTDELKAQLKATMAQKERIEEEIKSANNRISALKNNIEAADKEIACRRENWDKVNGEKFEFDEELCACPTCKRKFDSDVVSEKREELQKNFNEDLKRRKDIEVNAANQAKAEKAEAEKKINIFAQDIQRLEGSLTAEEAKLKSLQDQLLEASTIAADKKPVDIDAAVNLLMKVNADALDAFDEIERLNKEIAEATALLGEAPDFAAEKGKKAEMQAKINELHKQLGLKETIERAEARIEQLKRDEESNAQEIANIERIELDVEAYGRAKMDILEERVNSKFQHVRFRLFEQQVNGGVADTCVCEYQGVPYPTLNTAAKMLSGIDVLNTFSAHFGILAPVFVDNRESITNLPESDSQIISLIVSPTDKKLRIEAKEEVSQFV